MGYKRGNKRVLWGIFLCRFLAYADFLQAKGDMMGVGDGVG